MLTFGRKQKPCVICRKPYYAYHGQKCCSRKCAAKCGWVKQWVNGKYIGFQNIETCILVAKTLKRRGWMVRENYDIQTMAMFSPKVKK